MTTPLPGDATGLRERVEKRHEESQGTWPEAGHVCLECWQRWPCDAVQLLAATPPDTLDVERLARALHDTDPLHQQPGKDAAFDSCPDRREYSAWAVSLAARLSKEVTEGG